MRTNLFLKARGNSNRARKTPYCDGESGERILVQMISPDGRRPSPAKADCQSAQNKAPAYSTIDAAPIWTNVSRGIFPSGPFHCVM